MSPNPVAQRGERADRAPIAADAFLRALADHGVEYFFCNPGTDFPPIVEAFARAKQTNAKVPRPMVIPHENLAVAMAHGVYLMTGRPQAVMVHVNVGTANTINNITNMSRERAPVILAAGRTPISEKGTSARATARSIGRRKCSTRPACCASWSNGITSCARPTRSPTWSRAPSRWR